MACSDGRQVDQASDETAGSGSASKCSVAVRSVKRTATLKNSNKICTECHKKIRAMSLASAGLDEAAAEDAAVLEVRARADPTGERAGAAGRSLGVWSLPGCPWG